MNTKNTIKPLVLACLLLLLLGGCAYRHYLGMHGPSIQRYPAVHAGATEDAECLRCHDPNRKSVGLPTSHPQFEGCLKCHEDPVE